MESRVADPSRLAVLTNRQRQIATLAAQGRGNADIAAQLGVTEATVKVHTKAAYRALGISRRSQLVALVGAAAPAPVAARPDRPLPTALLDVARLIADGATNKQIAVRLNRQPGTVKVMVRALLRSLGLSNRVEVANWWLANYGAPPVPVADRLAELVRPGGPDAGAIAAQLGVPVRDLADRLLATLRGHGGATA